MQQMAPSNTILQTIVDDEKRGRVMSFYAMAFLGMVPFGSLLAGNMAARFGAPTAVMFNGVVCIAGSLIFRAKVACDPEDCAADLCPDGYRFGDLRRKNPFFIQPARRRPRWFQRLQFQT